MSTNPLGTNKTRVSRRSETVNDADVARLNEKGRTQTAQKRILRGHARGTCNQPGWELGIASKRPPHYIEKTDEAID